MSKPKQSTPNISIPLLGGRERYLNGVRSAEENQHPPAEPEPSEVQEETPEAAEKQPTPQKSESIKDVEKTDKPEDEKHEEHQERPEQQPFSKKHLLQHFLQPIPKDRRISDIFYTDEDLYDVFLAVCQQRKRQQMKTQQKRSFKKSHLLIEGLFYHPDVLEELRKRGLLK